MFLGQGSVFRFVIFYIEENENAWGIWINHNLIVYFSTVLWRWITRIYIH